MKKKWLEWIKCYKQQPNSAKENRGYIHVTYPIKRYLEDDVCTPAKNLEAGSDLNLASTLLSQWDFFKIC